MKRLGVNIDHIATLRQARGEKEPEPVLAATLVELGGADQITVHLREDRRHINDRDVFLLKQVINLDLNLEMSINPEIVEIALKVKPYQVTLVPEKRQELTTEGGLDVVNNHDKFVDVSRRLKDAGIKVSYFIDPDINQIRHCNDCPLDAIEIHTGRYSNAETEENIQKELNSIKECVTLIKDMGLNVNVGHGLTYKNVQSIADIHEVEELNIGHNIIARAVFVGLERAVREMVELINK